MDLKEKLESSGFQLRDDGDSWRARAFYRQGGNPTSLKISKKSGRFVDFSANQNGSFAELIYLATGEEIEEADADFQPERFESNGLSFSSRKFEWDELPKLPNYKFYLDRGIKKEVLQKFEAALVQTGKMTRRLCFPIRNERREVVGVSGRIILQDHGDRPKWKHLGLKRNWIYPDFSFPEIERKREVILVESIGDCLALYSAGIENVLVLFGVKIFPKIKAKLLQLNVNSVIIATNDDKENNNVGNEAAKKIEGGLRLLFSDVRICLPTKNDFGAMSVKEIENWYNLTRNGSD